MKLPIWILSILLTASIAFGAWNVSTLLDVKERVVRIETQLQLDRIYHKP